MAKQYVINFTETGEKIDLTNEKGEVVDVKSTKEMEIRILENLFMISMNRQKDLDKAFECRDCLEQVRNLDGEGFIKFTMQDIKYLREAFESSAERRPTLWLDKCYNLFKQIKDPEEEKDSKEEE